MPKDIDRSSRSLVAGRVGRRDFLAGASALGLSVAASQSLFARSARAAPKKGGHLRVGVDNGETTDSLDPASYLATFMMCTGFATHNTLTEIDPAGNLAGDLVEEWESSPDASTWTFKLRKGAEFSTMSPRSRICGPTARTGSLSSSHPATPTSPI
jgi:peptide/nickel transport system substrate-binding protein